MCITGTNEKSAAEKGTRRLMRFNFFDVLASDDTRALRWRVLALILIAYTLILKLIFMPRIDLIPEEAYYWNYARHLAWSYLDHPPMVAWLIWISTFVFGKSELGVRLPAFVCWIVAALFMFRLTANVSGRRAGYAAVLLLAVLPIFFGLGFFMTPDAPLFAAWVGCLYFLERALIAERRRAWWGVGLCLGFGLLSKYSIALLGAAALIYVLVDRRSRRWLLLPDPYLAAIIALVLFSPVLLWNMQNGWLSLSYQGSGRWSATYSFSLHVLLGSALLLLTPVGFFAIVRVLLTERTVPNAGQSERRNRIYLWSLIFTLVPLSVFVLYSLMHKPQLNWTAPVWLAAIPLVSERMATAPANDTPWWRSFDSRIWIPTVIMLSLLIAASFSYIAMGLPGAGPMSGNRLFGEWRVFAATVDKIYKSVEEETGSAPVVLGGDRNFISSELSFYSDSHIENIAGSYLIGSQSLMWAIWFPRAAAAGMNVLMVDFDRSNLMSPYLRVDFDSLSEIFSEPLEKDGRRIGKLYWRVGYRYKGDKEITKTER
jgi:dolichol-phosphate mannosyltransferase